MAIPMRDAVEGANGKLTPDQAAQLISLIVKASEVAGTLLRDARHFISLRNSVANIPTLTSGVAATWIDENDIKPASSMTFSSVTLTCKELAVVVPVSDRLLNDSYVDLDALVAQEISNEFANKLDKAIMGVDTPVAWGANASFNAAATAASGNTFNAISYSDTAKLFSAMLGAVEGNANLDRSALMFYVSPAVYQVLRDARTSQGAPLFVTDPMSENGAIGRIYGVPVTEVSADKFPTGVDAFLVDRSKAVFGTRYDTVRVARSNEATYTNGGNLRSAFERDETLWRAFNCYAFNVTDVEGFVLASGI